MQQARCHVVSFNPIFPGDRFIWVNHWMDEAVLKELRSARAVILPQAISREFYFFVKAICPNTFPNYDIRFKWEGKVGDAMLFWSLKAPHPKTTVFPRLVSLLGDHEEMGKPPFSLPPMPFVIKSNHGGEGRGTWLIEDQEGLNKVIEILKKEEFQGRFGFVIQEYIEGIDRTLRVVVIGSHVESYWREAASGAFYSNLAQGARVIKGEDPHLVKKGEEMVVSLCKKTGINLAGFDVCFRGEEPLFLEVNYTFGRTGLGGSERFYKIFKKEVEAWLDSIACSRDVFN
ncbi:Ribosomal protein S6 glutaminyl transferase [Dissulfuribacter thermophilus]|uniref:Ribosomal protein S6 glutaminyl transferase n=1 Tax=Dissulfuribacter thermophilus TaxID=1156395 RepID=A0A1B9F6I4_9BACT|nr:Ribosomal protein S6 glutaminyl transferase [Dissulfuribacter thermophilus]